ncbi:MAG: ATP-dependent DNA ligase, partial [Alphaproteobacteria bacterium]|nr:ATP-dependent DNA ligase [Alphaproteobacteria bacterium]
MSDPVRLKAGRRRVEISSPGKELFPSAGITKQDLARYYIRISDIALPLWRDRPLTMERYPDGIDASGFIQKQKGDYFPDWIESARLEKEGGTVDYVLPQNAAIMAYLANQGMITPHLGLSRIDEIKRPDRLIFDLDPSTDSFEPVREAALIVREALEELGATPFVMSTGSRGLHVVLPLDRSADFDAARRFAHSFADDLAQRYPDQLT